MEVWLRGGPTSRVHAQPIRGRSGAASLAGPAADRIDKIGGSLVAAVKWLALCRTEWLPQCPACRSRAVFATIQGAYRDC
jgi:hypothetical protein